MIRAPPEGAKWPNSSVVDGTSFLGRLQARTGLNFDLPTEAQWEYACRAGTTSTYYWGNELSSLYARYKRSTTSGVLVVGSLRPNNWGLYDMSGNMWELCLDWYGQLAYGTDPKGSTSGEKRVIRGGGWSDLSSSGSSCTSSVRGELLPEATSYTVGFRVSWTIP